MRHRLGNIEDASIAASWGLIGLVIGGAGAVMAAKEDSDAMKALGYAMAAGGVIVAGSQFVGLFKGQPGPAPAVAPRAPEAFPSVRGGAFDVDEEL